MIKQLILLIFIGSVHCLSAEDLANQSAFHVINLSHTNETYKKYHPIPEEVEKRIEVFSHMSYWTVSKYFPFGKNQKLYVKSEGIKSVTLREYALDDSGNPIISSPKGDINIVFDTTGNVTSQSKFSSKGKLIGKALFENTDRKKIITSPKGPKLIFEKINEGYLLSIGDHYHYSLDKNYRVTQSRSGSGLNRNVYNQSFKFDSSSGRISSYTNIYKQLNGGRWQSYQRDYSFSWGDSSPIKGMRTGCQQTGFDARYCNSHSARHFIFQANEDNSALSQTRHSRNLGNGSIYQSEIKTYTRDENANLVDFKSRRIDKRHGNVDVTEHYELNFEDDVLSELTRQRIGSQKYPKHTIFKVKHLKNKNMMLGYDNSLGKYAHVLNMNLLKGVYELRYRNNGELSRILTNRNTVLKVIDTSYYD